jgi:serine/threonine protein kinase
MADFKSALEALAKGKLELNVLTKQLDKLLKDNPKFAGKMLTQLDQVYDQKLINDEVYAKLKRQINEYRRAHATQTETAQAPADDEATVFAADAASEDDEATEFAPTNAEQAVDPDATQVLPDSESPATQGQTAGADTFDVTGAATSGVDFDISSMNTDDTGGITGATGPTGTAWQQPQAGGYEPGRELDAGDVIKERFKLIDVLGIGGMGKVFKGIDLLKEEARDKNPYVAIKLLNEDFKSHPEAFISLQRESSRQQKLAHPNIATVYDFDRIGGPGTPVFITMELMEGQDLSHYIKKVVRKQGGLPFEEAFNLTAQLASALSYAHERRLVHSDFKPGNAFLCNDGTVKTLDFGIARAVKNPQTGEVEKTLFDPGQLGALTPAYASYEMLKGEEPDTRDDTYALGCVAYELLTGKHPFNKLPADKASEAGLVPPSVKGLNKKQNRALKRSVAYLRKDRSPTVDHFIEEFEGKATWHKNPFVIAAGILFVVGLIAINPALNYLHDQEITAMIDELNNGGNSFVAANLDSIASMDAADLSRISDEAEDAIQNYFTDEVAQYINISGDDFNFPAAMAVLDEVAIFYPGSLFLAQQREEIEFNQKQKITDLYNDYIAALNNPDSIDNTRGILEIIRTQVDPAHPLLEDPRPANAYRLLAEESFASGNLQNALALVSSGLETAPDDQRLADLQGKIQTAVRVAELNQSLGTVASSLTSIEDFRGQQDNIIELASLSTFTESPVLATLQTTLQTAVNAERNTILSGGTRADAEALVEDFGLLLSNMELGRELASIQLAHLTGAERTAKIAEIVNTDKTRIDSSLSAPDINSQDWEATLLTSIRGLDSFSDQDPSIATDLANYRNQIASLYIEQATQILEEDRFDAADGVINRGLRFAPGLAALTGAQQQVATRKAAYEKELRVADLKDQFNVQTEADRVAQAQQIFDQLRTELGANDPFVANDAPPVLAASYSRLAQRRKDAGEIRDAYTLASAGYQLASTDANLGSLFNELQVEVNILDLSELFKTAASLEGDEIRLKVDNIKTSTRYTDFLQEAESTLVARVNSIASTDQVTAIALANKSYELFNDSAVLRDLADNVGVIPDAVQQAIASATTQVNGGQLDAARRTLASIDSGYIGLPGAVDARNTLESKMRTANDNYQALQGALANARGQRKPSTERKAAFRDVQSEMRNRVINFWGDNEDFNSLMREINSEVATIIRREVISEDTPVQVTNTVIASDRPCTSDLAGHGQRSRAVCADFVNTGWYGPQMVVIPAGGDAGTSFAISRYEISNEDWSKYCRVSGNCDQSANKTPVTGKSLQEMQTYVDWLSERTGNTYRLPTLAEWTYAASGGGKHAPRGNLNCRVMLQDKILKGTAPNDVNTGDPNGWGVRNYLGNVQEVVTDGSGNKAVGGAYSDSLKDCDVSLQKPFNGSGDETTGFRVLLEDIG